MLLLKLLSRLQNSNTSLLFYNLFTGFKFLNKLNIQSSLITYKILNTTQPSYLYDLVSIQPPHGHNTRSSVFTLCHSHQTIIITHQVTHQSFQHASPHLWNQLPTSLRIPHPNYSSPSQRPSFEHAGNLLHTAITFYHFFTVSLLAQNLPFH